MIAISAVLRLSSTLFSHQKLMDYCPFPWITILECNNILLHHMFSQNSGCFCTQKLDVTHLHDAHIPCIHCMGSIPCMGSYHHHVPTFPAFTAWVSTTTLYLHFLYSLCGFNSHCLGSIPCVSDLSALLSGPHHLPTYILQVV